MRQTMEEQAEELRLLHEKHLKSELIDEYEDDLKAKGLNKDQIERMIQEEMNRRIVIKKSQ